MWREKLIKVDLELTFSDKDIKKVRIIRQSH